MEKTNITGAIPSPSSGSGVSGGARIVRPGASRIVSRRNFLIQGGGGLVALSLGSTGCSDTGTGPSDSVDRDVEEVDRDVVEQVDVIVVGAGLSGLVAAYELVRAGYNVRVLEARNEAGGRAQTLREPFDDGLIAEAGPARIPPDHDRTLGYIDHFGIKTSPFYPQEGEYLFVPKQGDPLRETPDSLAAQPHRPWVIRGVVAHPRDLRLEAASISTKDGTHSHGKDIPEGTDVLPVAFAEALGDSVRYGSPVTRVVREDSGVLVTNGTGASTEELKGSYLICTVPLPVIDQIVFEPTLSAEKRAAFEALPYQDVTRVYVQYADRIWEGHGLNGWGESLVGGFWEFWHPTWNQEGPRGLLMSYLYGDMARTVAAMEPGTIVPEFIDRFDGFFPGSSEVAEHGTYFAWEHQPWIRAAYALKDPPFEEHPELASPEGRIHFAGEHASGERGWMQGALQSGLRAASEIDPAVTGESSGAAVAISPRRVARRFAAGSGVPGWLAV